MPNQQMMRIEKFLKASNFFAIVLMRNKEKKQLAVEGNEFNQNL